MSSFLCRTRVFAFLRKFIDLKAAKERGKRFLYKANKRIRVIYPAEITSNQYLFVADYKLLFELSSKFAAKVPRPFCVSYNTNEQKVDLQDFNSNKLLPGA